VILAVCSVSPWLQVIARLSFLIRPRSGREMTEGHWQAHGGAGQAETESPMCVAVTNTLSSPMCSKDVVGRPPPSGGKKCGPGWNLARSTGVPAGRTIRARAVTDAGLLQQSAGR